MNTDELMELFPDWKFRKATIEVTLWHDDVESDQSLINAIEQELECCHCVYSIDKIVVT